MHQGAATVAMLPNSRYPADIAFAGDSLTVYVTGIDPAAKTSVWIGGTEVSPESITPLPGFAGVYQLSLTLPAGVEGEDIPVSIESFLPEGSMVSSNKVVIAGAISGR